MTKDVQQQESANHLNSESFSINEWKVSPATLSIQKGEEIVKLEPKVMQVLEFLASRPGEVISRQELEDHVWEGTIVGYDAVTNTIIKLRKAFGDNPKKHHVIETIPKTGYRLTAEVVRKPPLVEESAIPKSSTDTPNIKKNRTLTLRLLLGLLGIVLSLSAYWLLSSQKNNPLPDKPSIAVIPFDNTSNNPAQNYFSDGITEDLITDLSNVSGLFVIARNSSFQYRGIPVDVKSVANELGVRYILQGNVRKDETQFRINVQLMDSVTDENIWAKRYDSSLDNLFKVQDEVTRKIVTALEVTLAPEDQKHRTRTHTVNIDAYDHLLRGLDYYSRRNIANNQQAKQEFSKAIELDPGYARAYAALALSYAQDILYGWEITDKESLLKASVLVDKAIQLDATIPQVYFVKGHIELYKRNYEYAVQLVEKAISIEPNYADGYVLLAWIYHFSGRPEDGLKAMESAVRLNPIIPSVYLLVRGTLYYSQERMDKAQKDFQRGIQINPANHIQRVWLAASYAASGEIEEAEWEVEEVLSLNPAFSLEYFIQIYPLKDSVYRERFISNLKQAGFH